jgi:hypothetical protein
MGRLQRVRVVLSRVNQSGEVWSKLPRGQGPPPSALRLSEGTAGLSSPMEAAFPRHGQGPERLGGTSRSGHAFAMPCAGPFSRAATCGSGGTTSRDDSCAAEQPNCNSPASVTKACMGPDTIRPRRRPSRVAAEEDGHEHSVSPRCMHCAASLLSLVANNAQFVSVRVTEVCTVIVRMVFRSQAWCALRCTSTVKCSCKGPVYCVSA